MDISDTLAPNSDGIIGFDLVGGPRVFTITRVEVTGYKHGIPKNQQYPVALYTAEFGDEKPYRPNLSMRRLLANEEVWGPRSADYAGRRLELFRDETVTMGGKSKPGVRISRVSHINAPARVTLPESRQKDRTYTVQPLPDVDPAIATHLDAIQQATTLDELKAAFFAAPITVQKTPQFIAAKDTKKNQLTPTSQEGQA